MISPTQFIVYTCLLMSSFIYLLIMAEFSVKLIEWSLLTIAFLLIYLGGLRWSTLNLTVFSGWKPILNWPISFGSMLSDLLSSLDLKNYPSIDIQLTSIGWFDRFFIRIGSTISNYCFDYLKLILISLDIIWYVGGS